MKHTEGTDREYRESGEYEEFDAAYDGSIEPLERDPLPAPLPAVREWLAVPLGLAGLASLSGAAAFGAEKLGVVDHALVDRATASLTAVGATPALLAIGGAALVGLAAGAFGRMRQTKRTLAALAQSPDYGAWLEDLDEGLQRMHVSLVTVEAHVAGAIDGARVDLARRIERTTTGDDPQLQQLEQALGGRLMRLESSVSALSATLARLEEEDADDTTTAAIATLVTRLEAALAKVEALEAAPRADATEDAAASTVEDAVESTVENAVATVHEDATPTTSVEPVESRPTEPLSAQDAHAPSEPIAERVDDPAPAMPVENDADECPVEGLPLFAAVENPAPRAARADEVVEPPRRNPYDA